MDHFASIIKVIPTAIVFLIFYLIARSSTKKYIKKENIPEGYIIKTALFLTFVTYFITVYFLIREITSGIIGWFYIGAVAYGILGTLSHTYVAYHRRSFGKNDITTILYNLTYICWQVMQYIAMIFNAVLDIIISLIISDWKETKKSIKAKEETEKYFRNTSIDKPLNYQDGLNGEYRKFIETTSVEDNSNARKTFADQYFKSVYEK